jgi:hypothetical protein
MLTSVTDASLKWCSTPPLWHIDAVGPGVHPIIVELGQGRPVVFLHGNGMMVEDMLISGVLAAAANHSFRHRHRQAGVRAQRTAAWHGLDGGSASGAVAARLCASRHRTTHRDRPFARNNGRSGLGTRSSGSGDRSRQMRRRMPFFPAGSSLGRPIASWPLPWPRSQRAPLYRQFPESMQLLQSFGSHDRWP